LTAYNPAVNGLAEVFNKTIIKLLKKFNSSSNQDWNEKPNEFLWAYWTTIWTLAGNTLFSLVWVWSSHIPRDTNTITLCYSGNPDDRWRQRSATSPRARGARWETIVSSTAHWTISSSNPKGLQQKSQRDRVLERRLGLSCQATMVMTHKTKNKFQPKWEGPFVVETSYSNGAYHLTNPNGNVLMMSINGKFLKKYFPW